MNLLKRTACFLLSVLLLASLAAPCFAENGSVSYTGNAQAFIFLPGSEHSPTDLFPELKNVMPGDTLTQQILVQNFSARGKKIKLYMKSDGAQEGTDPFLSQLKLTVNRNGTSPLFEAPADQTAQLTDWVYLGTVKYGGAMTLDLTLEVPITLGNEFQNAIGYIDWEFRAEEIDDPKSPKTGDTSGIVLYASLAGVSFIALLALLLMRRKK